MLAKLRIILIGILILAIAMNLKAPEIIDQPIIIDLSNTNNYSIDNSIDFCADSNYLHFDITSAAQYTEAIGTSQRFPTCVYNQTQGKNKVQMVDLVCLRAKCRKIVTMDQTNGNVRLVWQNDSYIYP